MKKTALVPYLPADLSDQMMARIRKRTTKRRWWHPSILAPLLYVLLFAGLAAFLYSEGFSRVAIAFIILVAMIFAYWYMPKDIDEQLAAETKQAKTEIVSCPHCAKNFDLWEPWRCGHCDENNGGIKYRVRYLTPLSPCRGCGEHQTAVQCPNCSRHIVFNGTQYAACNSTVKPRYVGVAKYLSDQKLPVIPVEVSDNLAALNRQFDDL